MASFANRTGFLGTILACCALAACGGGSTAGLNGGDVPAQMTLKTEFTPDSLLDVAERLRLSGDYNQALAFFQRAQYADPDDHRAFKGIGLTLMAMGAADKATSSLAHAAMLKPDDIEVRRALAKLYLADGQLVRARKEYQWLIARDPEVSAYYNGLAVTSDLMGDHVGAQANYSLAIGLAPENKALRNNLALSFAFSGDFEAAEQMLSDLQESPRSRQNLALVYGLAGKIAKAEETALLDLPMADARKNLDIYETLRGLPSHEQAAVILLGRSIGEQSAALRD